MPRKLFHVPRFLRMAGTRKRHSVQDADATLAVRSETGSMFGGPLRGREGEQAIPPSVLSARSTDGDGETVAAEPPEQGSRPAPEGVGDGRRRKRRSTRDSQGSCSRRLPLYQVPVGPGNTGMRRNFPAREGLIPAREA